MVEGGVRAGADVGTTTLERSAIVRADKRGARDETRGPTVETTRGGAEAGPGADKTAGTSPVPETRLPKGRADATCVRADVFGMNAEVAGMGGRVRTRAEAAGVRAGAGARVEATGVRAGADKTELGPVAVTTGFGMGGEGVR